MDNLKDFLIKSCAANGAGLYMAPDDTYPLLEFFRGANSERPFIKGEDFFAKQFQDTQSGDFSLRIKDGVALDIWQKGFSQPTETRKSLANWLVRKITVAGYFSAVKNEKIFVINYLNNLGKNSLKSGTRPDFLSTFPFIKHFRFDTKEEAQALLNFGRFYRVDVKKPEFKATFCDFISTHVNNEYHSVFEKLLGSSLTVEGGEFVERKTSEIFNLDKEQIMFNIHFNHVPVPGIEQLNSIHSWFVDTLKKSQYKNKLGLEDVVFLNFENSKSKAKMIFEYRSDRWPEMAKIYTEVIALFASNLKPVDRTNLKASRFDYQGAMDNYLRSHLLDVELPQKNASSIKRKI